MINRTTILLLIALLTALLLGIMFKQPSTVADPRPSLLLGTMSGWPPYVSINQQGEYEGFDIDLAHLIADRLGSRLLIKDMDTVALIGALEHGRVDLIMTGLCITPQRLEKIAMVHYIGEPVESYPLVFWVKIPDHISSLQDLSKLKDVVVAVEPGSVQESFLDQYRGLFSIKEIAPAMALFELKKHKITAALLEKEIYDVYRQQMPELVALEIPIDEEHKVQGCGIGIRKTNSALRTKIEDIIHTLKKDGTIDRLKEKWFGRAP